MKGIIIPSALMKSNLESCVQAWGSEHKKVMGAVGVDPEEGHRDDPRAGVLLLKVVEVGLV